MKLTKRKGFNFFRSYYDVYNELGDKDKLQFIEALFDRQFLGIKPGNLKGMAKFAYISQTNSIDGQVSGYVDKFNGLKSEGKRNGSPFVDPMPGGAVGGGQGGVVPPAAQEEVKGKGKVQEEGKVQEVIFPFDSSKFIQQWGHWKDYKSKEFNFNYKTIQSEQAALKELAKLSNNNELVAIEIIHQSFANGWKGFFNLKENGTSKKGDGFNQRLAKYYEESDPNYKNL